MNVVYLPTDWCLFLRIPKLRFCMLYSVNHPQIHSREQQPFDRIQGGKEIIRRKITYLPAVNVIRV